MKTTLVLPDGLVQSAKVMAAQKGISLSALVTQTLESALSGPAVAQEEERPFRLVTFKGSGLRPGVGWGTLAEFSEDEDIHGIKGGAG